MTTSENALGIEPMTPDDWGAVCRKYADGIATGNATFETEPPGWSAWDSGHLSECRLVARLDQRVVAWAALAPVSTRACYAGVAEHSIYVDESHRGQGIGKTLLLELVRQAERSGFWTLQSSILPENEASISIHLSCGFRVLGRRKAVARLHGIWRDAVLVERRSRVAGVE